MSNVESRIMKGKMYEIDLKLAHKLMDYIISMEMEELQDKEFYTEAIYNGQYNSGLLVDDLFSMSYGFDGYSYLGDGASKIQASLCVPKIYKNTTDFQDDIYWFLCKQYNFDLFNWGMKYCFEFEQSVILFDILHELGHLKQFMHEMNKYGYYKSYKDDEEDMKKLRFMNEEEAFINYRKLIIESYADKSSIEFLKKYGDTLVQFVNRGLLIETNDITEEELFYNF